MFTRSSELSRFRRVLRVALLVAVALVALLLLAVASLDRWLFDVLDPGAFDPEVVPAAPDYADLASWAALPELDDASDVALPEYPALAPAETSVDLFYVHPTTWIGGEWNAPFDDPAVIEATTRGATLIQASAFNACCAVHAPRYRQANGRAFTFPDNEGQRARDLAYADISAAFAHFLARNGARPFMVAGHSQGAILAARLLREEVADTPAQARFVAAYLPGAALRPGSVGSLPFCDTPEQTGCVASWNARGPAFTPNAFELDADDPNTMRGRSCVNPVSWRSDDSRTPATLHAGAIFFDTPAPALKPKFADAECIDGTLVVTELGDLERDLMSRVLLWTMGPENYHPIEYQLYYLDIRSNALARSQAFLARPAAGE